MKEHKTKNSSGFSGVLSRILGDSKRQRISIPLFSIVLAILAGSIVVFLIGKNPLDTYLGLLQGSGILPKTNYAGGTNQFTDFLSFLDLLAPMIFGALAVTMALKAGLFNIGVSGQMLAAGFTATILIGYSELPALIAKPAVVIIGIIVGGLLGALVGFLKYRFNINEVVSTIMFNYIVQYLTSYWINSVYVNPVSRQSEYIHKAASLTLKSLRIGELKMDIPIGIILAVLAAFIIHFIVESTQLGYEIKAVGLNKKASGYAGIQVGRTLVLTMAISGALAGLAGVTYYLGYFQSMQPRALSSLGYDSVATALLGNAHPIGVVFSSFLITVLNKGATFMSSKVGVVKEISGVIVSLILLFSAMGAFIRAKLEKYQGDEKTVPAPETPPSKEEEAEEEEGGTEK